MSVDVVSLQNDRLTSVWKLSKLLANIDLLSNIPEDISKLVINQVTNNSQLVEPGALFFAISGAKSDGRNYINQAVDRGAVVVIAQKDNFTSIIDQQVPLIFVKDIRKVFSAIVSRFYGDLTKQILSIGITGTNGKTSISWLISEALAHLGHKVAHLGTLGMRVVDVATQNKQIIDTGVTTPDALVIHQFLASAVASGASSFVAEVSSHGLVQARSANIDWDMAIFTNLTRDHLDYHLTMEEYASAKKRFFFEELIASGKNQRWAILNIDDPYGRLWFNELRKYFPQISCISVSESSSAADIFVSEIKGDVYQTEIQGNILGKKVSLQTKLVGQYNVFNVLVAATALSLSGFSLDQIIPAIAQVNTVPGRLERVQGKNKTVFIDYAHTPDALIRVQQSLRMLTRGKLITVFGCGGDRDRGKRSLMGRAVSELSDLAVVTSDNPRTEDPQRIIEDIILGVAETHQGDCLVEPERKKALKLAIEQAQIEDVVLIAGKGHETYQEVQGVKHVYSDKLACVEIFQEIGEI